AALRRLGAGRPDPARPPRRRGPGLPPDPRAGVGAEARSLRMAEEQGLRPRRRRRRLHGPRLRPRRGSGHRHVDGTPGSSGQPTRRAVPMGLDSGSLIKTLNKTCLNALQAAAGLCLSRTNPSVEVEHWLLKLVETPETDLTRLLRHHEVDTSLLAADLTRAIDRFRTGNTRTPVLSTQIEELIRNAWVVASVQYRATQVRSGVLLLALLSDERLGRQAREASRELGKVAVEPLWANLMALVAGSGEDDAAARDPSTGGRPEGAS